MIKNFFQYSAVVCVSIFLLFPSNSHAQQSQILSVTPPLFQLSALPGDIWQSSIKVVNGNSYPLTVFAEVVNFSPTGETGQGKFIPILSDAETSEEKATLAEWIEIAKGPYVIPPEQTKDVTFFVEIPENAAPGGHYSAILISTQPPETQDDPMAVQAMQSVTSLFFVRVEGDVHEEGVIREFSISDALLERPEAEFSLRFENKGNVHLQPKGDILITNMWGTVRGSVPVNYQTHFGNVLPESIRNFNFSWKSDFSIADVGRYKAIVTLAYGEDGVKNVSAATYFWVIPIKATLMVLTVLGIFISLIVWMVRAYVRRMLTLAGVSTTSESIPSEKSLRHVSKKESLPTSYRSVSAPLKHGVLDLRARLKAVDESVDTIIILWNFVCLYKKFFISLVLIICIFVTSVLYIGKATEKHDRYEVIIEGE